MNKLIRNITMLAMTGFILASCGHNTLIGDDYTSKNEIRFDNGYIDKPLNRAAGTTLLSEHMNTMGVWGWFTKEKEPEECIFSNQLVEYDTNEHKWTYSPKRYWSNHCKYIFNAYAPHSTDAAKQTVKFDRETRHFIINGITLKGDNTMIGLDQPTPLGIFKNVGDIDWLIDRTGQDVQGAYGNEVEFNMQHILSKICVIADLADYGTPVTIESIELGQFVSKGDFTQGTVNQNEWQLDLTAPRYTIKSGSNITVSKRTCLVESLIFPQVISDDQALVIRYSIGSSKFTAKFNLNELFSQFLTANNYIITITVGGPEVIKFDGGVSDWSEQEIHHYVNN